MPLLKQHMGHLVIVWIDEEALHPADLAIEGMDMLTRAHLCFTHRNNIFDDGPPMCQVRAVFHADEAAAYVRQAFHHVALRGVFEPAELRERAAQPDPVGRNVDQVERNKPAGLPAVLRLDDKVGDRSSGRVDDHAANLAAETI